MDGTVEAASFTLDWGFRRLRPLQFHARHGSIKGRPHACSPLGGKQLP